MITFKQFISEEEKPLLMKWLYEHCMPFLTACGCSKFSDFDEIWSKARLFRGLTASEGIRMKFLNPRKETLLGLVGAVRQDRHPRDQHPELSKLLDEMLEDKFHWKPRSAGLFVAGSKGNLEDYGDVYRIFPMGEFKFVWNPEIKDIADKIPGILKKAGILELRVEDEYSKSDLTVYKKVLSDLYEGSYRDDDLPAAIRSRCEIMIGCKSFIGIEI